MSDRSLPVVPMCEACPEPGRCCRSFWLSTSGNGFEFKTALHALVDMAVRFFPFIPVEKSETCDQYLFACVELRHDGRCGIYEHRPQLCRDYQIGDDPMCVYYSPSREEIMSRNIEERTKRILAEQLGLQEDEIKLEAKLGEDLGCDSLDTVEVVMALEEEFELEIPDEEAEKLCMPTSTVSQAIDYLKLRLQIQPPA